LADFALENANWFEEPLLDKGSVVLIHFIIKCCEILIFWCIFECSVVILKLATFNVIHELIDLSPFWNWGHCGGVELVGLDVFIEVFFKCKIFGWVEECPVNDLVTLPLQLTRVIRPFDVS
jgi:hypothetical protein